MELGRLENAGRPKLSPGVKSIREGRPCQGIPGGRINLQLSKVSMRPIYRDEKKKKDIELVPEVPVAYTFLFQGAKETRAITTTVFAQMVYEVDELEVEDEASNRLLTTCLIVAIPNGKLQAKYAPSAQDTIWRAGKHAPKLQEEPRTRISIEALRAKAVWRVQQIRWNEDGDVIAKWTDCDEKAQIIEDDILADSR